MPFTIKKTKGGWGVYRTDTGKRVAISNTKRNAIAHARIRMQAAHKSNSNR